MRSTLVFASCVLACTSLSSAVMVNISNVAPRVDTAGTVLDAHDGNVFFDEASKLYHWVAASYGDCKEPSGNSGCSGAAAGACGFRLDHNVSVFTSPDLKTWTSHPPVLEMADSGLGEAVLFCPKMLYNAKTALYVLWFNWIEGSNFAASYYAVATSKSPLGPFRVVVKQITTLAYQNTGDFNLFQDDDGTAYVIYTSHIQGNYAVTHQMSVERLTDDYLGTAGSSGNSGFFGASFVEAPAFFKRSGVYYAVFGQCCCYCQGGSPVTVYTSSNPLGPYATRTVLDPSGVPAQQSDIFWYYDSNAEGGKQYMWYGDRWQSAPDGIKGHDFTYWAPLAFAADGNITSFGWENSFVVAVGV